jgi:uncharacterized membrane protein
MKAAISNRYYYLAVGSYFSLFFLLMAWNTLLYPSTQFPVALVLIFFISPLLLPLRGFLRGKKKSCGWLGFISMIYFIHGISEAYANHAERLLAILEVLFSLLLFLGITFYLRNLGKPSE